MTILSMALAIFLVMNIAGHLPPIAALLKVYDTAKQRRILLREAFFAFIITTFYLFGGVEFLGLLQIEKYAMSIAGGTILLLVALEMIFPHHEEEVQGMRNREPYIVPIATPMLAGGGIFTTVVLLASQADHLIDVWFSICLACLATATIMLFAPFLQKILGKRGLLALEQLMGLIVVMMALQLIVDGVTVFVRSLS